MTGSCQYEDMPQLRQNVITREWVVIAPERSKRPSDFTAEEAVKERAGANCPFCLTSQAYGHERLDGFENDSAYTISNKFPAFVTDPSQCNPPPPIQPDEFFVARASLGGHDVIAIKDHARQLYDFDQKIWTDLLSLSQRRYRYWRHDCQAKHSMLIYNQGVRAGASIHHPHAQIFASQIVPNHISRELIGSRRYFGAHRRCVFCELIDREVKEGVRVVEQTDLFVAVAFYAARFPFEVWVLPKRHQARFEDESPATLEALGQVMRTVLGRIGQLLHNPPLNFFVHDLPSVASETDSYHWHVEITPRLGVYGGYELGSGTIINTVTPEAAADYLRTLK